jgi:hypothetical protein
MNSLTFLYYWAKKDCSKRFLRVPSDPLNNHFHSAALSLLSAVVTASGIRQQESFSYSPQAAQNLDVFKAKSKVPLVVFFGNGADCQSLLSDMGISGDALPCVSFTLCRKEVGG